MSWFLGGGSSPSKEPARAAEWSTLLSTDASGAAAVPIAVPNDPALLDAPFFEQFAVLDPAANSFGFAFSNAGAAVVGH